MTGGALASAEPSKLPIILSGAALVIWAVGLSVVGLRRADFPGTRATEHLVIAVTVALVGVTLAAMLLSS